jgi:endonuclease/exonuclease/phosphatase family metal-dependent hydrolase
VVSFNVHSLYGNQRAESIPETRSKVTELLAEQKGDIICIQEFFAMGEDFSKTLTKFTKSIQLDYYFFKNYQEFWNKRKINAIATFSRYPIVNSGYFNLPDKSLFALFSDIVIKGDTIRIYNLHLESIRFGNDDYSFYSHLTDPEKEVTPLKEGSKRMLWKLRKAFILRSKQVHILTGHIAACRYPVVLAGDFNDSPSSYTYHQLTTGLSDAFKEAGNRFFEGTYAGKLPSFRIDYILHSGEFHAMTYKKIDVMISDHYPITSTLVFNH